MCYEYDGIKPDIITCGKAMTGGVLPVSAIFANNDLMDLIKPGDHGSTFGGNPLGMAVAKTAVQIIVDEKLTENSKRLGEILGN